jgi:hypothetical protein
MLGFMLIAGTLHLDLGDLGRQKAAITVRRLLWKPAIRLIQSW